MQTMQNLPVSSRIYLGNRNHKKTCLLNVLIILKENVFSCIFRNMYTFGKE